MIGLWDLLVLDPLLELAIVVVIEAVHPLFPEPAIDLAIVLDLVTFLDPLTAIVTALEPVIQLGPDSLLHLPIAVMIDFQRLPILD